MRKHSWVEGEVQCGCNKRPSKFLREGALELGNPLKEVSKESKG
jgi:hypothetical protein